MNLKKYLLTLVLCFTTLTATATTILVAHPITIGLAELLLKNTTVEIIPAVPRTLPATRQLNYLEKRGKEKLANLSKKADAVITANSIFGQDYLYPFARRSNIKIIPIDIASPIDGTQSGVAKLALNLTEHPVWLNPKSLMAMMNLFSNEMTRLDPSTQENVKQNLNRAQKRLWAITENMEMTLENLTIDPMVLVTDPALNYFSQGLALETYQTNLADLSAPKLAKILADKGINLILTRQDLPENLQPEINAAHVKVLKIERLKADDPISQLENHYQKLAEALNNTQP